MNTSGENTLYIDGAMGEGGGQIVRTSVSLSAITGRTVEIRNIRAGRSKPGLQAQHLASVRAAGALCGAALHGDALGSTFLRMVPGRPEDAGNGASWAFDVAEAREGGSAGATGLVAQTVLVPQAVLFGQATTQLRGGTHVPHAPTSDYVEAVYMPMLRRLGLQTECVTRQAGYFPRGGGLLELTIAAEGQLNTPLDLVERGRLLTLQLRITTSQLPPAVGLRGRDALLKTLKGYGVAVDVRLQDIPTSGNPGAAVTLVAEWENGRGGWTGLGERGKPMERVAEEALRGFVADFDRQAATDEHLADQLVLPAALTPGTHRWTAPPATEHLRTVLAVTSQFLPIEYTIEERADGTALVTLVSRGITRCGP